MDKKSGKLAKRRVAFVTKVESAKQVVLTGDFANWLADGVPLHEIRQGEWAATLELRPGLYEYRLLIDGEWRDDPDAAKRVPSPFGTENCILTVV